MPTVTHPWDPAEHLDSDEAVAAYIAAAREDGDPALLAAALGDVARARGSAAVGVPAAVEDHSAEAVYDPSADAKTAVIAAACEAITQRQLDVATSIIDDKYPFAPLANAGRRYSAVEATRLFVRDGFIDRYSGRRVVFPGTLRLLSILLPRNFPFQQNWKSDACHFAFYELFPTIDHVVPVSRGGVDDASNWVTTSMLRNGAKANFTLEELGWTLFPPGDITAWDGLTRWFLQWMDQNASPETTEYLRRWAVAARQVLPPPSAP